MLRNTVSTFLSRILGNNLNLLIIILISRELGVDGKGETTLLQTTISAIILLTNVLGGPALVYLLPRTKLREVIVPAYAWVIVVSAIGYVVLSLFPIIPNAYVPHVFGLSALAAVFNIHLMILLADQRLRRYNFLSVLQIGLTLGGLVIAFYVVNRPSVMSFVHALYFAYGIGVAWSILSLRVQFLGLFRQFSLRALGTSFRYGVQYQIGEVLQLINFRLNFYLLYFYHSEGSLGQYSVAVSVLEFVWIIGRSVGLVQYTHISNLESHELTADLTLRNLRISLALSAIALTLLFLIPDHVFVSIFGPGFGNLHTYMLYLIPGIWIYNFAHVLGNYFAGLGMYKRNLLAYGSGVVVTLVAGLFLIPEFAAKGTALAGTLSFTLTAVILLVIFLQHTRRSPTRLMPNAKDVQYTRDWLRQQWHAISGKRI